jgi:hypothetical protein
MLFMLQHRSPSLQQGVQTRVTVLAHVGMLLRICIHCRLLKPVHMCAYTCVRAPENEMSKGVSSLSSFRLL